MEHVTKNEQIDKILSEKKLVVIDFYADWCGPCRLIAPHLETLSKTHEDVTFVKVNVDEAEETKLKYKISSIPTLIFFKEGKEIQKTFGAMPLQAIASHIEQLKS